MSTQPMVSVCIPSYNHARFLPVSIESVLSQSYRDFELIIVDDGSTDESLAIAEQYAARYPSLVKVFTHPHNSHRGISATANLALQRSAGTYWSESSSDDAFYPDKLEQQVAFLAANPDIGVVYGYAHAMDETGHTLPGLLGSDISSAPDPLACLIEQNCIYAQTIMAKRECLEKVGLLDETLIYSDWELWIRLLSHYRVGFIPRPLAMYRTHAVNTSISGPPEVQLERHLAVTTAVRQKVSTIGGMLDRPHIRALVELQLAYLLFCKADTVQAGRCFRAAFRIDPSLATKVAFFKEWLVRRQNELRSFVHDPTPECNFVRWTASQVHALGLSLESPVAPTLPRSSEGADPSDQAIPAGSEGSPKGTPAVSIVIPTFNNLQFTRQCLEAVRQTSTAGTYEIIVVDNASTDGTADFLQQERAAGRLRAIFNGNNLGFAKASNQGARAACGEFLVFLNNDTIPQAGWLDGLLRVPKSDPSVGVVGAKLLFPGTRQIQHAGVVFRSTGSGLPYHIHYRLDADHPAVNQEREFQAVTAACCLVRRELFRALGGFDEGYQNGSEDVDFCLRVREAGYRVVYTPSSVLYHHEKASIRHDHSHEKKADANAQRLHAKWDGRIRCDETTYYEQDGFEVIETEAGRLVRPKGLRLAASVVVVTYNSKTELIACVKSLYEHTRDPFELILVDNASADGTREYLELIRDKLPAVTAILNPENVGFAKAINQGIRAASGEYIVILNPDTRVTAGWLGRMMAHVKDGGVGAVGPLSNFVCGQQRLALYLQRSESLSPEAVAEQLAGARADQAVETKLLVFFCTLIPRAVLDRVGLLDEDFFLNHEDFEYSLRLTRAGYRLVVATDAFVYHKGEASKASLGQDKNLHHVYESARVLHRKLEAIYGKGRVPPSTELWGFEIFGLDTSGRLRHDLPGNVLADYIPPESATEADRFSEINDVADQARPRIALIYDNSVRADTTGEYCKRALQRISEVVHFLPRQLREIPADGFDLYLRIDDSFRYDVPSHLRPSAFWAIDTHIHYRLALDDAKRFDFVFCAQKDGAEQFQRDGIQRVWWLPAACDPEIHKPYPADKAYDVAFVGHTLPGLRTELLNLIQEHFPHSFVGEAYFEEMAKVYSRARIVFNRSLKNDVNMRVFEALASGSFLLTNDLSDNGQSELFQDKVHLVTYRSPGELLARISYYLEREEEREWIAAQGWEEVLAKHTYLHRMRQVLETCLGTAPEPRTRTGTRHSLPPHPALCPSAAEERSEGSPLEGPANAEQVEVP